MQAPSSTWYQGLRRDDGNPCRAPPFLTDSDCKNTPLWTRNLISSAASISAAYSWPFRLFVLFCFAHFWRYLCFMVIGDDTTECRALVRTTANQTQPQDMCEGTELDQLQRKTKGEDNTFYATTIGSILSCFHSPIKSIKIWDTLKNMAWREAIENKQQTILMHATHVGTITIKALSHSFGD